MKTLRVLAAGAALACLSTTTLGAHHEGTDNKSVAKGWWNAACGDLEGFMAYVDAHMADEGVFMPARYVGLGFQVDNEEGDSFGTVMMVTPDTPASEVLQRGDVFVSVNGMDMTWENRTKTTFRGKPGVPVKAVIRRDGKEMPIEVERGIIATANDKARSLEGLSMADAENWPTDSCTIHEAVQEGNVVYVSGEWTDTEAATGYEFNQRGVTRFEFNDAGKIVKVWNMNEDRFVLEQLGFTISR